MTGKSPFATTQLMSRSANIYVHHDSENGILKLDFQELLDSSILDKKKELKEFDKHLIAGLKNLFIGSMYHRRKKVDSAIREKSIKDIIILQHFHPDIEKAAKNVNLYKTLE